MAKKSRDNHQICCIADQICRHWQFFVWSAPSINGSDKEKRPQHQSDATGADPTEHSNVFFA